MGRIEMKEGLFCIPTTTSTNSCHQKNNNEKTGDNNVAHTHSRRHPYQEADFDNLTRVSLSIPSPLNSSPHPEKGEKNISFQYLLCRSFCLLSVYCFYALLFLSLYLSIYLCVCVCVYAFRL